MTFLVWAGIGVGLSSAFLHGAVGLGPPRSRTSLAFSWAMVFLCCYLLGQTMAWEATSAEELVTIERWQFCNSAGLIATLGWFAREYTGVRIPRWLVVSFYGVTAIFVIGNLVAPYSGFLESRPVLERVSVGGGQVTTFSVSRGPFQIGWLSFGGLFLASAIGMGLGLILRGDWRRGIVFVSAFGMMFLVPLLAVLDGMAEGRQRPSLSALGVLSLAVIMSVDLALDLRTKHAALRKAFSDLETHTRKISEMLDTSLELRDQLNTPLQTMELELVLIADTAPQVTPRVARLRRALDRLTDLGRRLQHSTTLPRDAARHSDGAAAVTPTASVTKPG